MHYIVSVLAVLEMTGDFSIHPAGVFLVVVVDLAMHVTDPHVQTVATGWAANQQTTNTGRCHYPVLHILGAFEPISE
jgi:hypothetical protein